MLNFRFLYILMNPRSVRSYLGLLAVLGFGVLLDIVIVLKLSLLIGPWITMALLAANSALGIHVMYRLMNQLGSRLAGSINRGTYDSHLFNRYLSSLAASVLLVIPGLVNSLGGLALLIPRVSDRIALRICRLAGIEWREAYEQLRLDYLAGDEFALSRDRSRVTGNS